MPSARKASEGAGASDAAAKRAAARVAVETHCSHTRVEALLSEGAQIELQTGGAALVRLVWEASELNPLAEGAFGVRYHRPAAISTSEEAISVGEVQPALRKPPVDAPRGGGGARALRLSVVNMQSRAVLVYAALLPGRPVAGRGAVEGEAAEAQELPLSPWEGAQPDDETPTPLSARAGLARGAVRRFPPRPCTSPRLAPALHPSSPPSPHPPLPSASLSLCLPQRGSPNSLSRRAELPPPRRIRGPAALRRRRR